MKVIVISNPEPIEGESSVINDLFEAGLELFHLRKPQSTIEEVRRLTAAINAVHRSKLVLHQFHELAAEFGIQRLHFREIDRNEKTESDLDSLKKRGNVLSTSVHQLDDLGKLSDKFEYAFYGPVFESISKPGYKPTSNQHFVKSAKLKTKVIAIGGITADNIDEVIKMNFYGAALLGAVWKDSENAVQLFKKCKLKATL